MDPSSIGFGVSSALGIAGEFASRLMGVSAREEETRQKLRALEQKKQSTLSLATARAAASGITLESSSVEAYLAGISQQYDTEMLGLRRAGQQAGLAGILGAGAGLLGGAGQLGPQFQEIE